MLATLLLGASVALLAYAFYAWATLNNDYFERNMPKLPTMPRPAFLLGTMGSMMMAREHMDDWCRWLYEALPEARVVGVFDFRTPAFVVRDPEIIKQITVKDFDHFENHKQFIDPSMDELFGNSLFLMHGARWRDMRATLSPAFTGARMRQMFALVTECASDMTHVLIDRTADGRPLRIAAKDLFERYATDVIATSAFGIRVNSFSDERNEFYQHGSRCMNFATLRTAVKLLGFRFVPALMRQLDVQIIDARALRFFRSMALDTMQERLERRIYRPDMINLLMRLKAQQQQSSGEKKPASVAAEEKQPDCDGGDEPPPIDGFATVTESAIGQRSLAPGDQHSWSDTELAAQCFLFFIAGFESVSNTLSFLSYELAVNPAVQQKLYEECRRVQEENGGSDRAQQQPGYDALQRMRYMDQVVSESLRLWPQKLLIDRECSKDYRFEADGDERAEFVVRRGEMVLVPAFALHRDAKYWKEPERFDPERFGDERKEEIVPGTYLPFGMGPRNCIGSRFALMEIKTVLYNLLLRFSLEPTSETPIPLRLAKAAGAMRPHKDIVWALKPRKH